MLRVGRTWMLIVASLVFGVVATVAVALGCATLSPAPQSHQFMNQFTGRGMPEYRALERKTPDTEHVVVMGCFGFGYRSRDIQYYDVEAVKQSDYPPAIRRSFRTELGWPNVALETNSRRIGARFGSGLSPASLARGEQALHDGKATTWRIRWSGFFFNTVLAASLPLGIGMYLGVRLSRHRTVIVTICLGLWLTLIIAWGCDLMLQWCAHVPVWPRSHNGYAEPSSFASDVRLITVPPVEQWTQFGAGRTRSIGYDSWYYSFSKFIPNAYKGRDGVAAVAGDSSVSLGWPAFALKGADLPPWSVSGARADETRAKHLMALFATSVSWQGFMTNWLFYSCIVFAMWKGPGVVRAWRRARLGRCPECGYPRGESDRCSECGTPLRHGSSH